MDLSGRKSGFVILVIFIVVVSVGVIGISQTDQPPNTTETDTIGLEDGYWHNDTISIDKSDGLNESELEKVYARSKARVEYIRQLEFPDGIDIRVISEEQHRESIESTIDNQTPNSDSKLRQRITDEAMFLTNYEGESVEARQAFYSVSATGYYSEDSETVILVSSNDSESRFDETILAHELVHALQHAYFDVNNTGNKTFDQVQGEDGVTEGDAKLVQNVYETEYKGDIVLPTTESNWDADKIHRGILTLTHFPYSSGESFVNETRTENGWSGVDQLYSNLPSSSKEIIHPDTYPSNPPSDITVRDKSTSGWDVVRSVDRPTTEEIGESGLYTMFWYQSYQLNETIGIPYDDIYTGEGYEYTHEVTTGWDGDRLIPYVKETEKSSITNYGYVWKFNWESESDARDFTETYEQLLIGNGGEKLTQQPNAYHLQDGTLSGTYVVKNTGKTVMIVKADGVTEVEELRPSVLE